jgi:manganese/zinc/iron transport system permease protein
MSMVSLTTVVSFESVGAILVVALLVAPAATAYLVSSQLKRMIALSALFGFSGSLGGYLFSAALDTSIAGGIATTLGIQFAVVLTLVQLRKK